MTADLLQAIVKHCALVREDFTPEQRGQRRKTLGSSEIAAVCGINPYATLHNVWLSKVHGVDFEGNEATMLGKLLEPATMAIYADRYGVELVKGAHTIGPEPWMSATPDAVVVGRRPGCRPPADLVECKLVGLRSIWMWGAGNTDEMESDEVPLHYMVQGQWQLLVCRASVCDIAALMGTEFRSYRIRANAAIQARLIEQGREFMERYVDTGKEPPVDGSDGAREMLKRLYPRSGAEPVESTPELEALAEQLLAARRALCDAMTEKQLRENQFKALLRDARGALGNGWRVRYATTKSGQRPFVFEHEKEKEEAA